MIGLGGDQSNYLYELYRENPSRPLRGYTQELFVRYGLIVGYDTAERWFNRVGPFRGSLRVTNAFPPDRDSLRAVHQLGLYLDFIKDVNPVRLVFADEKPMKEKDVYRRVRRDPVSGCTPRHKMNANGKNRYNILAACTLKPLTRSVEYVILKTTTTAPIFLQFVRHLVESGTLVTGDVFVVDNCTVHVMGDNSGLKETLLADYGILMMTLPPYSPELNPTELVFNTLLQRLASVQARYNAVHEMDFLQAISIAMNGFSTVDVAAFFNHCGYKK